MSEQETTPPTPTTLGQPSIEQRVAFLESTLANFFNAKFPQLLQNAINQYLAPIRDDLVNIKAAIAPGVETVAEDALAFVKEQIAAIEQHLTKTPQAGGVAFKPASPTIPVQSSVSPASSHGG